MKLFMPLGSSEVRLEDGSARAGGPNTTSTARPSTTEDRACELLPGKCTWPDPPPPWEKEGGTRCGICCVEPHAIILIIYISPYYYYP